MVDLAIKAGSPNVGMIGLGVCRPKRVVTNEEVCEVLDSSPEWILEKSGIRSRRWISDGEDALYLAVTAGQRAIENSGINAKQIDALIFASGSWQTKIPGGGPPVATALGLNGIPAFELSVGCAGFGYGLSVAADMVRAGSASHVLVVSVETMSLAMNPTDRDTAFIFGDGGGAVVVAPTEENGISPTVWGSDGEHADAIAQSFGLNEYFDYAQAHQRDEEPLTRPYITMKGPSVFRWAAVTLPRALSEAIKVSGVDKDDIEVFIPHQANARINDLMKKNLGLGEHVPVANDIEFTGNTSAASIPLAMEELLMSGKAKEGQLALLLGFGAGLSYAGSVVRLPPAPQQSST